MSNNHPRSVGGLDSVLNLISSVIEISNPTKASRVIPLGILTPHLVGWIYGAGRGS